MKTESTSSRQSWVARLIGWCMSNRFLVITLTLLAIIAGIVAVNRTPLDAIPDLSDVQVIVYTNWMGRDSQTIEDQVTYPLTTALLAVPKVSAVRGFSFFGFSLVYVIFDDGTDIYWARSRVLEYLDQVKGQIPEKAKASLGPDATGVGWVYQYTVEDTENRFDLSQLRALQDYYIRYQLTSVPGVAEVASVGGFQRQYQVTVDPSRLSSYGIPLKKVVGAIKDSNNDVGGRLLEMTETEYMVRGRGYIREISDIEDVVIGASATGTPILVRDVAQVAMGPDIRRGIAEKDGQGEVVGGVIVMRFGENALDVIGDVKKKIAEISPGLPEGVVIKTAYDRSSLIVRSIDTLRHQLLEEMLIVALICILFLWHAQSALVAAISLPLGILISFIVMNLLGINANIMSLGGIAIAIGAMVDAAVVLVENAHKKLEENPDAKGPERWKLIISASQEVGPALFFSLLIITVSFLPVFALQGQAGRLFKPLAYTKTFAMAAAALIAVTITPILMGYFIRGKIHHESRLPLSRLLIAGYRPLMKWTLRHKLFVIVMALVILLVTWVPYQKLGSEFMPPLNEGDILYMPTSLPGISETEAKRVLQTQDKLFKTFPEVDVVFGKIGRAETATDPAPLTMVETTVTLKPSDEWPRRWLKEGFIAKLVGRVVRDMEKRGAHLQDPDGREVDRKRLAKDVDAMARRVVHRTLRSLLLAGVSRDDVRHATRESIREQIGVILGEEIRSRSLVPVGERAQAKSALSDALADLRIPKPPLGRLTMDELMYDDMDKEFQFIGLTNAWTMPIKTRIDMLATGIKTPIGIKIFGDDLEKLEDLAIEVERIVKKVPGTLSAVAERVMGGNYVDFDIDRQAVARYGLTVGDVQDYIETAVGGMNVTETVEGRYRFPVNIRYPRELRDDPEKLARVLVTTAHGQQVPMQELADIVIRTGPPAIKSENSLLQAIVYVDLQKGQDVGSYVELARQAVMGGIQLPPGYYISWSGQYEQMQEVNDKLKVLVPVTLILIFLLLYFNFRNLADTGIVLLSLPFALVGGIWYLFLLDYNLSVAVGIGFIALAGLAAETGVVMLVYLDLAYAKELAKGGRMTVRRLYDAIVEGAVMRVRPKMMTVMTTIMALLPIMWATGAGARPMKRMAAPMIGGLVSSLVLTLVVIPVIYALVKEWKLRRQPVDSGATGPETAGRSE